jgi:hypothetical protein
VACYIQYWWTTPLEILFAVGGLILVMGWPALAGVILMVATVPLNAFLGKFMSKYQGDLMRATDGRVCEFGFFKSTQSFLSLR